MLDPSGAQLGYSLITRSMNVSSSWGNDRGEVLLVAFRPAIGHAERARRAFRWMGTAH